MNKNKVIFLGLILGMQYVPAFAQNYYKWVDKNGNTTYSNRPPPAGMKAQQIGTLRSPAAPPKENYSNPQYRSNESIPDTYHNYYKSYQTQQTSSAPRMSAEQEALRQAAIKSASTPHKNARGLTAAQRNTLASLSGNSTSGSDYSGSSSYSAPITSRAPSVVTNCDGAGCWGTDGTRYNKGAGNTYFPSTGGVCHDIGGQMQCN